MHTLFVYGSLRRDEFNAGQLHGARYLGTVQTAPRYALVSLDAYPGLVAGDQVVTGELYEVGPQLIADLDEFEEAPTLFRRGPLELSDGRMVEAYFYAQPIPQGSPRVPSGDWAQHRRG